MQVENAIDELIVEFENSQGLTNPEKDLLLAGSESYKKTLAPINEVYMNSDLSNQRVMIFGFLVGLAIAVIIMAAAIEYDQELIGGAIALGAFFFFASIE